MLQLITLLMFLFDVKFSIVLIIQLASCYFKLVTVLALKLIIFSSLIDSFQNDSSIYVAVDEYYYVVQ